MVAQLLAAVVIAIFTALITAAPTEEPTTSRFSIETYYSPRNKFLRARGENTTVTSNLSDGNIYLSPVTIGTRTFTVYFDTGSSDFWAFSDQLSEKQAGSHILYSPSADTKELGGYTWNLTYGDGNQAEGNVYTDTVTLGTLKVPSQAIGAAQSVSTGLTEGPADGILGLGFSSINSITPEGKAILFDTIKKRLDQPIFAAALKYEASGTYDFGYIDKKKYEGEITYMDVDSSGGFWSVTFDGYGAGDVQAQAMIKGIIDTGTSLIHLPRDIVQGYYSKVPGSKFDDSLGFWTYPCNGGVDFALLVNAYKAVIPAAYINIGATSEGSSTCVGAITETKPADGVDAIFGALFLASQYVVFDPDKPRLGLAPQAGMA
ncbi:hypothetical protein AJ78_01429 [Emergomyces pasteurianus Ep9510]|uniref:Peptidase A1 domain-containing protein n=1 Tax=Emergomyces pasteurianus Ep9510 TaxID=1447872 RepID=A0A1J9QRS3_9EURO|nr:hypothetical protein AJ78_01429 [Emergomyces pasteurianus Ep9510]